MSSRVQARRAITQSFSWALEQIGKDIDLKLSPHDLRRTFLSIAEAAGVSEFAKKQLVGHTVESDVTDGYTVLAREDLRRSCPEGRRQDHGVV